MQVVKRNGHSEELNPAKVQRVLDWASQGLDVDTSKVFSPECYDEFFYDGITTDKIQSLLANKAETLSSQNWDWSKFGSRLLLQKALKEAHGTKTDSNYLHFSDYWERVNKESTRKLQYRRAKNHFDFEALNAAIKPERDLNFEVMGLTILMDRYLLKNASGHIIESPQHYLMRVAMGLALAENKSVATSIAIEFYNYYSTHSGLSSTPTLFNSCTEHSQLSSCFVSTTKEDSLEGIYDTAKSVAKCSKFSGGTANSLTPLRSKGSHINSTGGQSSGVIKFAKIFEDTVRAFDQGGKRPGVIALYLEVWHKDIFRFLKCIDPAGDERESLRDINIASWIPDLFMERLAEGKDWTLFSPDQTPELHELYGEKFKARYEQYEADETIEKTVVPAKEVWLSILECLFNFKGNGWPCFKDTINNRSMTRGYGVVHCSNLCTEITLRQSADRTSVCNLGSINLANLLTIESLETAIRTQVKAIDNAVTEGYIPITEGKLFNDEDRPLGMGVMGYVDFLANLGIAYESEEHIYAADALFQFISYIAIDESSKLGVTKGNFPMFAQSQWAKGELPMDTGHNPKLISLLNSIDYKHEFFEALKARCDWEGLRVRTSKNMRNSTLLAIAPTASISNILGVNACTELPLADVYQRTNLSGDFIAVSSLYRKYKDTNPKLVANAKSVDHMYTVWAAAARQRWVDQAQSTNIWARIDIGTKNLSKIYRSGWEYGLKTFYYLHTEAETVNMEKNLNSVAPVCNMEAGCEACE